MKHYFFTLMAFMTLSIASAQSSVSGIVSDEQGGEVIGATVLITGTTAGTVTDENGRYQLSGLSGNEVSLTVTFIGYTMASQVVALRPNTEVVANFSLLPDNKQLEELVVVAYGTRKKEDLTGSVTSVTARDFQKGNINSPEQLLTGKVAGLNVTTGGGAAGGGSRLRIRSGASLNASNEPLLVVDGIPIEGNGIAGSANLLNTINPNDIESVSILKDASATALYGSRASNGVIIITTKTGQKGKMQINFSTQVSLGTIVEKVDVYSGDQIRELINARGNQNFISLLGTANTDWQDEIYQNAFGNDNNLSVSGAVGDMPYRVSVGYLNQDGLLRTNNFNRLSGSVNLNPTLFDDHLKINVAVKAVQTNNVFANEGAVNAAVMFDPTQPVHTTNNFGNYWEWLQNENTVLALGTRNPVALLELRDNTSTVNRFLGNIQLDYKLHFFPDLHVYANLGMDKANGSGTDITSRLAATDYLVGGRVIPYEQGKTNTLADVGLLYEKQLGANSSIDVLLGHSYQDFYTDVKNFPQYSEADNTVIPGTVPAFETDKPQYRLESYLGRVNLTLANKYLITGSLRRDASSKFSPDNRVGYFPAVAVAWKLHEEIFPNSTAVSDLKVRLGWGVTGQQDIGSYYSYLPTYNRSNETAAYQFGDTYYTFLRPGAYDANIRWETTTTTNIGLDFGFLNNRVTGSIDLYNKKTKDLLSVIPVAPGSNFDIALLTNVGNMENRGIEFTLNTTPVYNEGLIWNFGFNVTYNESKISNLLSQPDPSFKGVNVSNIYGGTGNQIGKFAVDYAPYTFYVYKQVYDEATGRPIEGLYDDLNRDGVIDDKDRYLYTKPAPDVLFGVQTNFIIRKFSVGLAGHAAFNNYVYNNYSAETTVFRHVQNSLGYIGNASAGYDDTQFANNEYLSDYYIENGSFFRLDNINLGYNVGRVFRDRAGLRLNASVQNVVLITKYKGLDPELAADTGIDNNIYPRPRIYSVGFNLDF